MQDHGSLVADLEKGFKAQIPYHLQDGMMVALNPYQDVTLDPTNPSLSTVSEKALNHVHKQDQSILVSGESGMRRVHLEGIELSVLQV